tara:strand:- start:72 stop:380 length:309 start_codon:yes stop_codon:yes gene_type:complete
MQYLEYKLDAGPGGMHTPYWVDDGGYWGNPDNHTMIGATRDSQEFKIPDTVTKLTAAELETRQLAIHAAHPMIKQDEVGVPGDTMTEAEVRTQIQNWVTAHS